MSTKEEVKSSVPEENKGRHLVSTSLFRVWGVRFLFDVETGTAKSINPVADEVLKYEHPNKHIYLSTGSESHSDACMTVHVHAWCATKQEAADTTTKWEKLLPEPVEHYVNDFTTQEIRQTLGEFGFKLKPSSCRSEITQRKDVWTAKETLGAYKNKDPSVTLNLG